MTVDLPVAAFEIAPAVVCVCARASLAVTLYIVSLKCIMKVIDRGRSDKCGLLTTQVVEVKIGPDVR